MWSHPGKQLLFMGSEFGQRREWSEERELDWELASEPGHEGLARLIGDLNAAAGEFPALWRRDPDSEGFQWIDPHDAEHNVLVFARHGSPGDDPVVVVANLSPVPHETRRIGLPAAGRWVERLNTEAEDYGGSGLGNLGAVEAAGEPSHGMPASTTLRVPPLGVLWLVPER
jgi:1,4-alpha-glucan branching enzyme